jgi:hypothetical protein
MKNIYKLSLFLFISIFVFFIMVISYSVSASNGVDALKEYNDCIERPNEVLKQTAVYQECTYNGVTDLECLEKTTEYQEYLIAKEESYTKCEEEYQKKLNEEDDSQIPDNNMQNKQDLEKNKEIISKAIKLVNDKYRKVPINILENAVKKYQDEGLLPEQADVSSEELITQRQSSFTEIENNLIQSMQKTTNMRVLILEGDVEMKIPGSKEWTILKQGDQIPNGATIFTGMDSNLLVVFGGVGVAKILSFSEITFNQEGIQQAVEKGNVATELKLRVGDIEVRVDKGTYSPTMQVETPQSVTSVRGTHFWVSSDEKDNSTITGVYEGEVEVIDIQSRQSIIISPISDGTPQIAVSINASSKESSSKLLLIIVIALLFLGLLGYFIYKKFFS